MFDIGWSFLVMRIISPQELDSGMHAQPLFQVICKRQMDTILPSSRGQCNLVRTLLHCSDVLAPLRPCVDCKWKGVAAMGVVDVKVGRVINSVDEMMCPKAHCGKPPAVIKVFLSTQHLEQLVPLCLSVWTLVIGRFAKTFGFKGNDVFDELGHHFVQGWVASSPINPGYMLVGHEHRDARFGFA